MTAAPTWRRWTAKGCRAATWVRPLDGYRAAWVCGYEYQLRFASARIGLCNERKTFSTEAEAQEAATAGLVKSLGQYPGKGDGPAAAALLRCIERHGAQLDLFAGGVQ